MKQLLLILFLIPQILMAEPFGAVSIYGGGASGLTIDAGTKDFRFEIAQGTNPSYGLKYRIENTQDISVWVGVNSMLLSSDNINTSDTWDKTIFSNTSMNPVAYIELEHSSGLFLRSIYGQYHTSNIFRKTDSLGALISDKVVSKEITVNITSVGYKWKF